ncbi:MAG: hypothetical protein EZS28_037773, partial [Streblomastix strix]
EILLQEQKEKGKLQNRKKSKSVPKKASKVHHQKGSNSDDEQYRESEEENSDTTKRPKNLNTLKSGDSAMIGEQSTDITEQQHRKRKSTLKSIHDAQNESEGSGSEGNSSSQSSQSQSSYEASETSSTFTSTEKKLNISLESSSAPSIEDTNQNIGDNKLVKIVEKNKSKKEKDQENKEKEKQSQSSGKPGRKSEQSKNNKNKNKKDAEGSLEGNEIIKQKLELDATIDSNENNKQWEKDSAYQEIEQIQISMQSSSDEMGNIPPRVESPPFVLKKNEPDNFNDVGQQQGVDSDTYIQSKLNMI